MHLDAKMRRLREHCGSPAITDDDLLAMARLVEMTEYGAGSVAAPAGVAGRWRTRVLAGTVATTAPPAQWGPDCVLSHGPETALVAVTDVVLVTALERDVDLLGALAPRLFAPASGRGPAARGARSSRSQVAAGVSSTLRLQEG
jgi:hypothetical protein